MVLIQEMSIETFVLRFRLEKYLVTGIENRNAPSNSISTHSDACMPHALWYFVRNDDEKEKKKSEMLPLGRLKFVQNQILKDRPSHIKC